MLQVHSEIGSSLIPRLPSKEGGGGGAGVLKEGLGTRQIGRRTRSTHTACDLQSRNVPSEHSCSKTHACSVFGLLHETSPAVCLHTGEKMNTLTNQQL